MAKRAISLDGSWADERRPLWKPEPRKRAKARRKRQERAVVRDVRAEVAARDWYCRVRKDDALPHWPCVGPSEWAHLHSHGRYKTRGLDPSLRHTTAGSLMLCRVHHAGYDHHELDVVVLDEASGANGDLKFEDKRLRF